MMIKNKTYCLVVTAICLTALSLPSHAWRAAGNAGRGAARGNYGGAAAWNRNAAVVRGPQGNTAVVNRGGAYRPPVYGAGYRPPAYYHGGNYGYSSGQVAAAGVAGLAVGAMAGAAVANNNNHSSSTTVIVQQPSTISSLPAGCISVTRGSTQYYQCGASWYAAYFGGNGVYYQAVAAPY